MTFVWGDAHREAMFAAAQLHEDLSIDCTRRVDVYTAIHELGIRVMFRPLQGCAGAYFPAATGVAGILIHSGHPTRLQRYTAAHELGHHVFGHGHSLDSTTSVLRSADVGGDPEERLAEAFAAWFLMPPELVDAKLAVMDADPPYTALDIYGLALRLGTSYSATCVHLKTLRVLSSAEASRFLSVQPRSIKEQIMKKRSLETWRRDVWVVSAGAAGELLNASPGDQIVFSDEAVAWDAQPQLWGMDRSATSTDEGAPLGRASFEVPSATFGSLLNLDFVDPISGSTRAAIQVKVDAPREGLLVSNEFDPDRQENVRVVVSG